MELPVLALSERLQSSAVTSDRFGRNLPKYVTVPRNRLNSSVLFGDRMFKMAAVLSGYGITNFNHEINQANQRF